MDIMKLRMKGAKTTKGKAYEFLSIKHGLGTLMGNLVLLFCTLIVATPFNLQLTIMVWIIPIPITLWFAFLVLILIALVCLLMAVWRPIEQGLTENENSLFFTWLDRTLQMVEEAIGSDTKSEEDNVVDTQGEVMDPEEIKIESQTLKDRIQVLSEKYQLDIEGNSDPDSDITTDTQSSPIKALRDD